MIHYQEENESIATTALDSIFFVSIACLIYYAFNLPVWICGIIMSAFLAIITVAAMVKAQKIKKLIKENKLASVPTYI